MERRALTEKEFRLAMVLCRNTHGALARTYLIEAVWGPAGRYGSRTLDTHLARLKSELGLTAGTRLQSRPRQWLWLQAEAITRAALGMNRRQAA